MASRQIGFAVASLVALLGFACSGRSSSDGLGAREAIGTTMEAVSIDGGGDGGASAGLTSTDLVLRVSENTCAANLAQDYFEVTNGSSAPVPLSNITIKYWLNDTSGGTITPEVWYGGCVTSPNGTCVHPVQGVTATATQFAPACGPNPNQQANWEITVSATDTTPVAVGQTWSNVQTAVNLSNYANFVPGTGTWFSPCGSGKPFATNSAFAVYDQGNLVFSNGITTPSCRGPQGREQLSGYATPALSSATFVGPVPASTVLQLVIGLPVRDPQGFQNLAQTVSDPENPSFRQYLTPDAFTTSTYAPLVSDFQNVMTWAQSNGLTVTHTSPNRLIVDVTGTVSAIEQALFANVVFRQRPDGTRFFVLDRDPSLNPPPGVSSIPVLRISGLDNFAVPTPAAGVTFGGGSSADGNGFFQGTDFRNAYASCTSLKGEGQRVGLFELDGYFPNDITYFKNNIVPFTGAVTNVLLDDVSGTPSCGTPAACVANENDHDTEPALDIEMALSMAPALDELVVFTGSQPNDVFSAMATRQPLANQLSVSWFSFATDATTVQLMELLDVQGQSVFTCSGDSNAYHVSSTDPTLIDPGDDRDLPYNTIVGGTVLALSGGAWSDESGWSGSGGGILTTQPIPTYQKGLNTPANRGSGINRNVPDVAAIASNNAEDFVNCTSATSCTPLPSPGTSIAAPLWAGFMALVNEQGAIMGLPTVGFANPRIYAIGQSATYGSDFHDEQIGCNTPNPCTITPPPACALELGTCCAVVSTSSTGYCATVGYDLVTGWGSPQCQLISDLSCLTTCGGICKNLETDPTNCGACGTVCAAGQICVVGTCAQPPPTLTVGASGTVAGGPVICFSGAGFTKNGTVTVEYSSLPEGNGSRTVTTTQPVSATGTVNFTDTSEISFVAQALSGGVSGCTAAEISSGLVIADVIDNTTGVLAPGSIPASFWCEDNLGTSVQAGGGCLPTPPPSGATRSYAAYECSGPSLEYSTNGVEVGNQGGSTALCPLVNDSTFPLNSSPAPTVFLNGDFTIGNGVSVPITVEVCAIDSQTGSSMNCGPTTTMSSGNQQVAVPVNPTQWVGLSDDDGFFIYVDTGSNTFNNSATLWSYETK